jgi:hypothetical protein
MFKKMAEEGSILTKTNEKAERGNDDEADDEMNR